MNIISIRKIKEEDSQMLSDGFAAQGWDKPVSQYQRYLEYQNSGERDILIAEYNNEIAGYLTILWRSNYLPFQKKNIPEIVDMNVFKKHQRKGIATALMDEAERRIKKRSPMAGIGFGVTKDYGAAQIIYIKRGYIPDGNGLLQNGQRLHYGDSVTIDHSLAFCLIKEL